MELFYVMQELSDNFPIFQPKSLWNMKIPDSALIFA